MNTLDRYIARQFFLNAVCLLLLLCCFVVAVDVTLNIDRFIKAADTLNPDSPPEGLKRAVVVAQLIGDLWWPRLLQLFNFLSGMILVAAMGFTITQLVRHREMVAMLAGGISLRRAARPIIAVALVVLLLQAANQEFILPRIAPLLPRDHGDAGRHALQSFEVALTTDAKGRLIYAEHFDPTTHEITGLRVWTRNPAGEVVNCITAATARWSDDRWILSGAQLSSMDASTPTAAPESTLITDLDPTAIKLRRYATFSHNLAWQQIASMLTRPDIDPELRERLQRIAWGRISVLICNLLTLLISLPFFLTREPLNPVLQSLKCAPVGIGALIASVLGSSASIPLFHPALGVFLPVFVLAPIAVAALSSMKT